MASRRTHRRCDLRACVTNSSEQLRQASIPRAERQIVHEAFKVAQVGARLTFSQKIRLFCCSSLALRFSFMS
jgi:hypothetical protein